METPEKTKEFYQKMHENTGTKSILKSYNKEIHMRMLMEIEQAADRIRKDYINRYGRQAINPSLFDIVESEVED